MKILIEKKNKELKTINFGTGNDKLSKEALMVKVNMLKAAMGI